MEKPIIEVKNIGKKYNITHHKGGYVTLREVITNNLREPFKFAKSKVKKMIGMDVKEEFWAVKNVNFTVKKGEVIGIIGRNGSGKSTLLKILSQITPPATGEIILRGRVGSLLEVGTGFHPELTGRENIFLNGAILGMKHEEIARKFDKIVEFSGVEKFLDTPVKHYSSGMYVRLAFSVAAHMEPDILIVDEVLAVGDAEFQKKCLGKMEEITQNEGRTIIFVSHNMSAIQSLCKKCIWLENGSIKNIGDSDKIITEYLNAPTSKDISLPPQKSNDIFEFKKIIVKNSEGKSTHKLRPKEPFTVEVHYHSKKAITKPFFWIDISSAYGHLFGASMIFDNLCPETIDGDGVISCRFLDTILLPQTYSVSIRAVSNNGVDRLTNAMIGATSFQVIGTSKDYDMNGVFAEKYFNHDTPLIVPYEWIYSNGKVVKPSWQKK